jgi:hypothetical protein
LLNTAGAQIGSSISMPPTNQRNSRRVQLLHQQALAANRVEDVQQLRPQQPLRRDRRAPYAGHTTRRTRGTCPGAPRRSTRGWRVVDGLRARAARVLRQKIGRSLRRLAATSAQFFDGTLPVRTGCRARRHGRTALDVTFDCTACCARDCTTAGCLPGKNVQNVRCSCPTTPIRES